MPRISAGSVREHRERRREQIVAAAEDLLAQHGIAALTAGAVAGRAGIARNSLYRYFDTMDDLVELVVTREFPAWRDAVREAVDSQTDPQERAAAYVRANVHQAALGSHGWRSSLSRDALSPTARQRIKDLHHGLAQILDEIVRELDTDQPDLLVAVLQSMVDACIRRIDAGDPPDEVTAFADSACRRLLG